MMCPTCNAETFVRDMKRQPRQARLWRRRECENGHRFSTYEVCAVAMTSTRDALVEVRTELDAVLATLPAQQARWNKQEGG